MPRGADRPNAKPEVVARRHMMRWLYERGVVFPNYPTDKEMFLAVFRHRDCPVSFLGIGLDDWLSKGAAEQIAAVLAPHINPVMTMRVKYAGAPTCIPG